MDDASWRELQERLRQNMPEDIFKAHQHSINNQIEINASTLCGCFYCLRMYEPSAIDEWVNSGKGDMFPMCPYCGIDSVIGDASGYPITHEFLEEMHEHWF